MAGELVDGLVPSANKDAEPVVMLMTGEARVELIRGGQAVVLKDGEGTRMTHGDAKFFQGQREKWGVNNQAVLTVFTPEEWAARKGGNAKKLEAAAGGGKKVKTRDELNQEAVDKGVAKNLKEAATLSDKDIQDMLAAS